MEIGITHCHIHLVLLITPLILYILLSKYHESTYQTRYEHSDGIFSVTQLKLSMLLAFFSPYRSACIHSKHSMMSLQSHNTVHVDICSNPSTPHSSQVLFTNFYLSNLGILRLLLITGASHGLGTEKQYDISTIFSTRFFR